MARSASVDPLERFRFTVSFGTDSETTAISAGFHDIQMPKRSTNVGTYREGIDPDISQIFAGLSSMDPITLSRGLVTGEASTSDFYQWISSVHTPTAGHVGRGSSIARPSAAAANEYKKDITITMLDREGNQGRQWTLYNAFPTDFVPGSDLNASEDGDKSLESLTLSYEDFKESAVTLTTQ